MKMYKAIFFDLDGTLLPMNMEEFTGGYFKFLCKKLAPFNLDNNQLIDVIWKGTGAMVMNDGSSTNQQVFWDYFSKAMDCPVDEIKPCCDQFYSKEFQQAKCFTGENPLAVEAVRVAREKADIVALTTNPLFPMDGQITRMGWLGLAPSDFDLITSYEDSHFCKPNPQYFAEVCQKLGVKPSECLLIGNDEKEDMFCCSQLGIDGYLVTDSLIECKEHPWQGPRGSFAEMIDMLKAL